MGKFLWTVVNYDISFLGVTRCANYSGEVEGLKYINLPYPTSKRAWMDHLRSEAEIQYVKKTKPDIIIAYNFPALGLYRIMRYSKTAGIKVLGDITEWYKSYNFLKWIDTSWRMRSLHNRLDGLIVISRYLERYYINSRTFLLPPTVDSTEDKWIQSKKKEKNNERITLLYAGSPGRGDKDRLDNLIVAMRNYPQCELNVVGITEASFSCQFPGLVLPDNVIFHGRMTHEKTLKMLRECDFSVFFRQSSRPNNAGFPTKFVEAQTMGIPVVTSHFSDLDAYIECGKNGLMSAGITLKDIEAVMSKISLLSKEQIEDMHTYTCSFKKFDYRNYQDKLLKFVEDVVEK